MLTRENTPFSEELSNDPWWNSLLVTGSREMIESARDWLAGQLGDLRLQRRQKSALPKAQYEAFLSRQSGYERLVRQRWDQVVARMRVLSPEPTARLRKWNKELRDSLRHLATVVDDYLDEKVDEDALEDALDDITVTAKGKAWPLKEALDGLDRFRWEEGEEGDGDDAAD